MKVIHRHPLFIGYAILSIAMLIGFSWTFYLHTRAEDLAERLEQEGIARAAALCESQNAQVEVIRGILDSLMTPREDDTEEVAERRREFREEVEDYLQPAECPPPPPP